MPPPKPLSKPLDRSWGFCASNELIPYAFLGGNAFPLRGHCLKPYPGQNLTEWEIIFGCRLSRFRRCSENGFGILGNVFRIFSTKINVNPEKSTKVILAAVTLYSFLRAKLRKSHTPSLYVDQVTNDIIVQGSWRHENNPADFQPLPSQKVGNNSRKRAEKVRNTFADRRFYGAGQIPWQ